MELNINKALEVLEQTPNTITSLLENLSEDWIFANEEEKTWSPFDIVGHLIHGEKTDWITRLEITLKNDSSTFKSFDRFAQFDISKGKTIHQLLSEFKKLRQQNIAKLKMLKLTEKQLTFKGNHPQLGVVTVKELLATWVTHDLGHLAQINRVMAKQYKNQVGPWLAYIPILKK